MWNYGFIHFIHFNLLYFRKFEVKGIGLEGLHFDRVPNCKVGRQLSLIAEGLCETFRGILLSF